MNENNKRYQEKNYLGGGSNCRKGLFSEMRQIREGKGLFAIGNKISEKWKKNSKEIIGLMMMCEKLILVRLD